MLYRRVRRRIVSATVDGKKEKKNKKERKDEWIKIRAVKASPFPSFYFKLRDRY